MKKKEVSELEGVAALKTQGIRLNEMNEAGAQCRFALWASSGTNKTLEGSFEVQ